ncbi:hypothetical protein MKX01_012225 [Papaver californicum]|nr:hypothetical protein MKX01_012225 [Papaver californicum]
MEREPLLASQIFQDEVKNKYESNSIVRQALFLLIFYLLFGAIVYSFNKENFSGSETHPVVDAIYFCIVTLCTVGYGDIAPINTCHKINYALNVQEILFVANSQVNLDKRENSSNDFSVRLAFGVVIFCIVEKFDVVDSVYLSVMSVITVGSYGGKAFNTFQGRLFASLWLLESTLSLRIDKRHRSMAKWILHKQIIVEDLLAADINNNGFISKAKYTMHKLKQMGTINE